MEAVSTRRSLDRLDTWPDVRPEVFRVCWIGVVAVADGLVGAAIADGFANGNTVG